MIDLDVDEEEQQTTHNVVEITLDDNKDKYSSDKENEIIMVRDSNSDNSDDEEEEKEEENEWKPGSHLTKLNGAIRCEYCSRNFRYRRNLNMHLLVCKKSPTKALNIGKRKSKGKANLPKKEVKKQYTCKICQEKFDAALALARHVRLVHLQRKKDKLSLSSEMYANPYFFLIHKITCYLLLLTNLMSSFFSISHNLFSRSSNKSLRSVQEKETSSMEEEESDDKDSTTEKELSMLARVKRKRKQRNNYSVDKKKLDCADCGRWFPSSTLLNAHSLQHGTKKSGILYIKIKIKCNESK